MELNRKKLFLLDMDGTLYLGTRLFEGTKPFLRYVRASGGKYLFLTNNSSRSVDAYIRRMKGFGIDSGEGDYYTSVNALISYLHGSHENRLIYAFGTETFSEQLRAAGFNVTETLSDEISVLICGFDTELTFRKLEDASRLLLRPEVEFIATNPDWVCPTEWGSVPDCGSVCEMLYHVSGRRPKVIGKPQPEMALLAMELYGYSPEETLLVGDRIYTDIACGVNAGIDTCFVLSGEGVPEDIERFGCSPAMICKDISELTELLLKSGS